MKHSRRSKKSSGIIIFLLGAVLGFAVAFIVLFSVSDVLVDKISGLLTFGNIGAPEGEVSTTEVETQISPSSEEPAEETTVPEEGTEESTEQETQTEEQVIESVEPTEIQIRVYFSDSQGEFLVGEVRTISTQNAVENAIRELLKGPQSKDLYPVVPANAKLLGVRVENGIAHIDFSSEFIDEKMSGTVLDILMVNSIVNTVTEIEGVKAVIFYVEGERLNTVGSFDTSKPVTRNEDIIMK